MFICSRCKKKIKKNAHLGFSQVFRNCFRDLVSNFQTELNPKSHQKRNFFKNFFLNCPNRVFEEPFSPLRFWPTLEALKVSSGHRQFRHLLGSACKFFIQLIPGPESRFHSPEIKGFNWVSANSKICFPPPPYLNNFIQKGLLAKFFTFFMVYDLFIE